MTIRIVIADDHTMLREGLSQALDSLPDIEVVATAADGMEQIYHEAFSRGMFQRRLIRVPTPRS